MRVVLAAVLAATACHPAGSAPVPIRAPLAAQGPAEPSASPYDIDVPEGYRIALVADQLTTPTGIAFGDKGRIFVIEADAHLVELTSDGAKVLVTGDHAPWTGIAVRDGAIYVAEADRIVRFDLPEMKPTVLVDNLPSQGEHHTSGPVVASDGWVYFGQGTATNAGIAGPDQPADIPCRDVTLVGANFDGTGAFLPHGTPSERGQIIKGQLPCSGAIMRVKTTGGPVELVAWGFRNPAGLALDNGALYATDDGYDLRGSRPVFGSADVLWKVEMSHWYGWPDYSEGRPLTAAFYAEGNGKPGGFVLADHPEKPREPRAYLPVHSAADGLDFTHGEAFGFPGSALIALPERFEVVRVDPRTGDIVEFAKNHAGSGKQRFDHPVAARFDPTGAMLYVVDSGGRIWKITREAQYAND